MFNTFVSWVAFLQDDILAMYFGWMMDDVYFQTM